ncbi:MAG: ATP synthase F0 subunit C [Oscillospiraceae bacterium]|nr:ATP synthase F0 subunit C [Oscillospiraceae bacterium]
MNRRFFKKLFVLALAVVLVLALAAPVLAAGDTAGGAETAEGSVIGSKAIAAGIAVGIAAAGGAVAMGLATAKSTESIARQPEAEGKIRTTLMLGLVFIETAIIYALLVVILIIFVL